MTQLILLVLGLSAGSFVNALVWRTRQASLVQRAKSRGLRAEGSRQKLKSKAKLTSHPSPLTPRDLSIWKGRSMCVHCHHELAWYDLIPVISWLTLGGKCRYCKKPISTQYPIVELATAGLFLLSYVFWPTSLHSNANLLGFITWLVILVGLVALFIYDLRWKLLPNRIVYPLIVFATVSICIQAIFMGGGLHQLQQAFWAVVIGGGLFYVLFQVSGGKWIGGGDVKLGALLGLAVGTPGGSLLFIFIASLAGTIASIPLLVSHKIKSNTKIPFGPLLIIGVVIAKLFGASIIHWYYHHFLLI